MRKRFFVLSVVIAIAFPAAGLAEDDVQQSEAIAVMEEVVVTATKTEEKRKDIPNAIVVKDALDIDESPVRSVGELLAGEPGLDWRTQGNFGGAIEEIHIRGMSSTGTQVLVNGTVLNSPSLGTADVGRIPLNNIERVEVVKGSGSLLYGSGAMGGTVNIITKRPGSDGITAKASAGYGTQDTYLLSVEQGMFVWDSLGYYLTANRKETEGFRDNSDLRHNDVSLKVVYEKEDLLDISLYGDYIDREFGIPGIKPPEGTTVYIDSNTGEMVYNSQAASLLDHGTDEDAHLVLQLKSKPLPWLGMNIKGDYTTLGNFHSMRFLIPPFPPAVEATLPGSKSWTDNKVLGTEGHIILKKEDTANLLIGGDYKDFDWENEIVDLDATGSELSATRSVATADLHSNGVFVEGQYRPVRYVKGLVGIRHEEHSTFGSEDLPRYGLTVNPLENTVLKASHGKHFRAPTPNDLFWPDDGFTRGNPDLLPETGWHSDATVEQALFNSMLIISASYFHWDIDNKIQWEVDSEGVFSPQNLRTFKANGFEAGVKIGPWRNMRLDFNYTYTDAEEESRAYTVQDFGFPPLFPPNFQFNWVKRRAAYTPNDQLKVQLTYWTSFGLSGSILTRYVGDRVFYRTETDGAYPNSKTVTSTLDSYWTLDVKLEQRLYEHWLLTVTANNILDEEYDTFFGSFFDETGTKINGTYPGAGRSVFFSASYEF